VGPGAVGVNGTITGGGEMNADSRRAMAFALILLGLLVAVGGHWATTTIIADTSPPSIVEAATTSGDLAYISGKPHLILVFTENLGVQEASAEIRRVGVLGTPGALVEKVAMKQTSRSGTRYQYDGRGSKTLEANKEYLVVYRVSDTAGNVDTYRARIRLVGVEARVYVNGVEVKSTHDKIVVRSLDLFLKAVVTQGAGGVENIYATVTHSGDSERVDFTESGSEWVATYHLPEDGSYTLYVKLVDTGGGETMLASFTIELGAQTRGAMVYATLGFLALAAVYLWVKEEEKPR